MTAVPRWPDFLVIGAYKSGTTALHQSLQQHPELFLPRKEVNYFAFAGGGGRGRPVAPGSVVSRDEYLSLFEDAPPRAILGDSSPEYMANPDACPRIAATVPDVRLIAVLRNPIDRAYSDFMMYRRDGHEPCARFADALDQQQTRSARNQPAGYYLSTGFYAAQLRPFFDAFSREQLHVVLYDDLRANFVSTLSGIFEFLGVDPTFEPARQDRVNVSGVPANRLAATAVTLRRKVRGVSKRLPESVKSPVNRLIQRGLHQPELGSADRARLVEVFRTDVTELGQLIDRDLSDWLRV